MGGLDLLDLWSPRQVGRPRPHITGGPRCSDIDPPTGRLRQTSDGQTLTQSLMLRWQRERKTPVWRGKTSRITSLLLARLSNSTCLSS